MRPVAVADSFRFRTECHQLSAGLGISRLCTFGLGEGTICDPGAGNQPKSGSHAVKRAVVGHDRLVARQAGCVCGPGARISQTTVPFIIPATVGKENIYPPHD
jgi:hypothetical protein